MSGPESQKQEITKKYEESSAEEENKKGSREHYGKNEKDE